MDVEEEDRIYEIDARGERVVVKSIESRSRAFLRFTNRTHRHVDIWWRDFRGARVRYARIKPRSPLNMDTYLTHPWEFTDAATKERYVIANKYVFRAPTNLGGMRFRTNWNITIAVRTLRHTALLAVASFIKDPDVVSSLPLPRVLVQELRETVILFNRPLTPTQNT